MRFKRVRWGFQESDLKAGRKKGGGGRVDWHAHFVLCLLLSSAWSADAMLEVELPSCSHEATMNAKVTN